MAGEGFEWPFLAFFAPKPVQDTAVIVRHIPKERNRFILFERGPVMTRSRSTQKTPGAIVQLTALLLVFLIGQIAFAVDTSWIVVPAIASVYASAIDHSRQRSNRSCGRLSSLSHWPRWHRSFPSKLAPSLSQSPLKRRKLTIWQRSKVKGWSRR